MFKKALRLFAPTPLAEVDAQRERIRDSRKEFRDTVTCLGDNVVCLVQEVNRDRKVARLPNADRELDHHGVWPTRRSVRNHSG